MADKIKMTKKEFTDTIYSLIISSSKDLFDDINKNSLKYNIEAKIDKYKILNFKITNNDNNKSFKTTGYSLGMIKDNRFIWSKGLINFFKEQFIKFAKDINLSKNIIDVINKIFEPNYENIINKKYSLIVPYLITALFAYSDVNIIEFESKINNKNVHSYMIINDFPIDCDKKTIEKTNDGFLLMKMTDDIIEISRNNKNINNKIKKNYLKKASENISRKFINIKNIKKYKQVK